MTRQIQRYQERVWEEVDPDTADRLREADSEVARKEEVRFASCRKFVCNFHFPACSQYAGRIRMLCLTQMLKAMRDQIELERENQESLLRDYRSHMRGGSSMQRPSSASLHASDARR